MSSSEHNHLIFFLLFLFFLGLPRLSNAGIEFLSTPSPLETTYGAAVFDNTWFRFSSDRKPVSFHFSGSALRYGETDQMGSSDAVLDYAYLGVKSRALRTDFFLGRIQVNEGIAGDSLDGIYSRTDLGSTRFSFFSGRAVGSGDGLLGGRFACTLNEHAAAGLSYVSRSQGSEVLQEEAAVNLRLRPFNKVALSGRSLVDLRSGRWNDHSYSVLLGPFRKATLLFDGSLTSYTGSGSPVQLPAFGGGIQYSLSRHLAVAFDVHRREEPSGAIHSEGAHVSCSFLRTWRTGASIMRRRGQGQDTLELDLLATRKAGDLEASLNLQTISTGRDDGSSMHSLSAALGLTFELSPAYRLIADLRESRSAGANVDFSGFLRVEYRFGT